MLFSVFLQSRFIVFRYSSTKETFIQILIGVQIPQTFRSENNHHPSIYNLHLFCYQIIEDTVNYLNYTISFEVFLHMKLGSSNVLHVLAAVSNSLYVWRVRMLDPRYLYLSFSSCDTPAPAPLLLVFRALPECGFFVASVSVKYVILVKQHHLPTRIHHKSQI